MGRGSCARRFSLPSGLVSAPSPLVNRDSTLAGHSTKSSRLLPSPPLFRCFTAHFSLLHPSHHLFTTPQVFPHSPTPPLSHSSTPPLPLTPIKVCNRPRLHLRLIRGLSRPLLRRLLRRLAASRPPRPACPPATQARPPPSCLSYLCSMGVQGNQRTLMPHALWTLMPHALCARCLRFSMPLDARTLFCCCLHATYAPCALLPAAACMLRLPARCCLPVLSRPSREPCRGKFAIDYNALELGKCVAALLAASHWFACIWALQTSLVSDSLLDSWLGNFEYCKAVETLTAGAEVDAACPAGWSCHAEPGVACLPHGNLYAASVYWAVMSITSIGYGDIAATPYNAGEQVVCTLLMLICGMVTCTSRSVAHSLASSLTQSTLPLLTLTHRPSPALYPLPRLPTLTSHLPLPSFPLYSSHASPTLPAMLQPPPSPDLGICHRDFLRRHRKPRPRHLRVQAQHGRLKLLPGHEPCQQAPRHALTRVRQHTMAADRGGGGQACLDSLLMLRLLLPLNPLPALSYSSTSPSLAGTFTRLVIWARPPATSACSP